MKFFLCLESLNRIDYTAESIAANITCQGANLAAAQGPSLNGFFIRDDFPANYVLSNYQHFNYNNNGINAAGLPNYPDNDYGFCPTFGAVTGPKGQMNIDGSASADLNTISVSSNPFSNIVKGRFASEDHATMILMACALVKELIDPNDTDNGTVFGYGAGGTSLRQQAIDIASRLSTYISSDSS
ncbi:MAG: hypothetical protein JSU07_03215 [Bacteroidetes bacterium]|nr:hypothetical protein [Bacteroidota bacterium]